MRNTLKNLIPYLLPYKGKIILASLSLIFTSLATLSLGQGLKILVDRGFGSQVYDHLVYAILVLLVLGALMGVGTFIRHYLVSWIGERVASDLRKSVYSHVIRMEPSFFEENSAGEIQSRILTDTTILQSVVGSSFSIFLRNALVFILGVVWLFFTNAKLTSIVLVTVPFIVFPIIIFGKKVRNLSKDTQDSLAGVGSHVNESLLHIKIVQAFHRQEQEENKMSDYVEKSFSIASKRILFRSILIMVVILLILLGISLMIWIGGKDVIDGKISPGELVAFSFYAVMVASSLGSVSEVIGDLQRAAGATERLIQLLGLEPKIQDPPLHSGIGVSKDIQGSVDTRSSNTSQKFHDTPDPHPLGNSQDAQSSRGLPNATKIHLQFRDVGFYYSSKPDMPALDGVDLVLDRGKVTALVGPSGAGKSTIFDLILRFHDVSRGSIFLDGKDLRDYLLANLREKIALVPQQPGLFSGTIRENLKYGRPSATKEEVISIAEASHAWEFIQNLKDGLDSLVGENGIRLSGGQKQRIAIGRALLKDPEILLLDEATSALDAESELHIQKAFQELTKDRTTLMIAHRLSTVVRADKIYVLDQGKVVGEGTHSELLHSNELYSRLAKLQFIEL